MTKNTETHGAWKTLTRTVGLLKIVVTRKLSLQEKYIRIADRAGVDHAEAIVSMLQEPGTKYRPTTEELSTWRAQYLFLAKSYGR